jgi:serine/threonine protein phosphatase 1
MYYIIGDIHGTLYKLVSLYDEISELITGDDTIIFLGDYIDRGPHSFEVIEFLFSVSLTHRTIFLKGNHEDMFLNFLYGRDTSNIFIINGGDATLRSYRKNVKYSGVPEKHIDFFKNLKLYFEEEDFIAVHAGINPRYGSVESQPEQDCLWIREDFFRSSQQWEKTVIFGHTPTMYITRDFGQVYIDGERNIIGIDTGAVYGGYLSCIRMPDRVIFQS